MSDNDNSINRRDFLKIMGWTGTSVAVAGCGATSIESGVELVQSQVQPEDYAIPGIGVYFASTCTQCEARCGIHGKVREGRVLKLEGNPDSAINKGRLCGLGQAAVQAHFHPERLREPMLRKAGARSFEQADFQLISWDEAFKLLNAKTPADPNKFAFLSGSVSGHLKVLLQNYVDSLAAVADPKTDPKKNGGAKNHFVYEALNPAVNSGVHQKFFGVAQPLLKLSKAQLIVSFGADFLGAWGSPVHFAGEYAAFRKVSASKPRGVLVAIEPKMTLTGANADRWMPLRAGTEGALALGLAHQLLKHPAYARAAPAYVAAAVQDYTLDRTSSISGVPPDQITRLADLLKERSPSLILCGASAAGHAHGTQNAAAIMLLNVILGNVGKTLQAPAKSSFQQIEAVEGRYTALHALNQGLSEGRFSTVFIHGSNPVYTAPEFMKLRENLRKAEFKVVFAHTLDETAMEADLILPLDSATEDWGTHVAAYQPQTDGIEINLQQPLMEKIHPQTRSMGDILLTLLKARSKAYDAWEDYYAYLKHAVVANKAGLGGGAATDNEFWERALGRGVLSVPASGQTLDVGRALARQVGLKPDLQALDLVQPALAENAEYPLQLVPSVRAHMRDGRHANLPWLQESPDPLTTIVWDSWVEIHPTTAARLGIKEGDLISITSKSGTIKTQAYLFPGIHPDVVSVPIGLGHEAMGRYAKNIGVNPLKILDPIFDQASGELAMSATRVHIKKTGEHTKVTKDEGPVTNQAGRKLVVTIHADKANFSKEV